MKRLASIASLGLCLGCPAQNEGELPLLTAGGTSFDDDDTPDDDDDDDDNGGTTDDESVGGTEDESDSADSTTTSASASDTRGTDSASDSDSVTTGVSETDGTDTAATESGGDPNCYSEPLDKDADIDAIVGAYGGADWKDDVIAAMDARWPAGAWLLNEQRNDSYFDQFSDSNSWTGMVGWLDTLTHEETHLFNAYHAGGVGEAAALYFREDLIVYLPADQGFPRSEILSELAPALASSIYADTYLTGSSGQRGFNPLLDETACYENEVPGMAVFGEYYNGGISLRDGVAAFLYFIEIYLRVGRTQHPDWYDWAQSQPEYVEAVLLLWQRAHFFFDEVGDDFPNLGINDATYRAEAYKEENISEIEMFVGADLDASPCINQ